MINGSVKQLDVKLRQAFDLGYSNAAKALGFMTHDKIEFNNFHSGFHEIHADRSQLSVFRKMGSNVLVTTEIFGAITGKSYLLLSEKEVEVLTSSIPRTRSGSDDLKEEFIKELDNILSASVITQLSNSLKQKMYGDVPMLAGKVECSVEQIITDDFLENAKHVYVNSAFFSFSGKLGVLPFFIWVLDTSELAVEKEAVKSRTSISS